MILIGCIVLEGGGEGVNRKESCLKEQEVFVVEGKEGERSMGVMSQRIISLVGIKH